MLQPNKKISSLKPGKRLGFLIVKQKGFSCHLFDYWILTTYFPNIKKYPVAHEKILECRLIGELYFLLEHCQTLVLICFGIHNLNYPCTKYFTKITNRVRLLYIEGKGVDICINTYKDTNTNTSLWGVWGQHCQKWSWSYNRHWRF